jgi:hypothetical protein
MAGYSSTSFWGRALLISAAFLLSGCNLFGSCGDEPPEIDTQSTRDMAAHLPGDVTGAVVVQKPLSLIKLYSSWMEGREESERIAEFEKRFRKQFNFSPYDPEAWQSETGVDWSQPVLGGYFEDSRQLVLALKAADTDKFATYVKNMRKADSVSAETVEGQTLQVAKDTAWCTSDSTILLVTATDDLQAQKKRLAGLCEGVPRKESLAALDSFDAFDGAVLSTHPAGIFVRPKEVIARADLDEALNRWAKKHVTSGGVGFDYTDGVAVVRGWTGMDADAVSTFRAMSEARSTYEWADFGVADTLMGLRLAFHPQKGLDFMRSNVMTEQERKDFEASLEALSSSSSMNIDVQKDVVDALTGQVGFFLHDIEIPEQLGRMGIATMAQSLKGMLVVQFKDAEARDTLLKALYGAVPTRDFDPQPVETAEGESDAEVQVTRSPIPVAPNLYLHKNVAMLATSGVGDDEARAFLMGTRKDKNLTQLEGRALGAEFVSADHFNGVYVNYERVHAILPDAGIFTSAKSLSEPFKEQLFQARVVDSGVFYEAQTELNPKGPALGEFIDGFIGGLGAAAGSAAPSLGGGTMDDGSMGGGVPDEDLGGDLKLDPPSGAMPGGGPSGGGLEDGPNLKLKNFESD